MKKLFPLIATLLLISCSSNQNPTFPQPDTMALQSAAATYETEDVICDVDLSERPWLTGVGKHQGELKWLEVQIIYKHPEFLTSENYAGYYLGSEISYEIRLRNLGPKTYKHLTLAAIQEYHETGSWLATWLPNTPTLYATKDVALPGESTQQWDDIELKPRSEMVLKDTYTVPMTTCPGLTQTHLIIQHTNNANKTSAVIYYNPEAAIYCPPAP